MRGNVRDVAPYRVQGTRCVHEYVYYPLVAMDTRAVRGWHAAADVIAQSDLALSCTEDAVEGLKPAAKAGQRAAFLRVLAGDLSGTLGMQSHWCQRYRQSKAYSVTHSRRNAKWSLLSVSRFTWRGASRDSCTIPQWRRRVLLPRRCRRRFWSWLRR